MLTCFYFSDRFRLITQTSSGSLNKMVERNVFYTLFTILTSGAPKASVAVILLESRTEFNTPIGNVSSDVINNHEMLIVL